MAFLTGLSAGLLTLLAVASADFLFLGRSPLTEGPPQFNSYFALRTLAIAAAACAICFALPFFRMQHDTRERIWIYLATTYASATLVVVVALLAIDPALYSRLAREDGLVEWASAIFLICAGIAVLWPTPKNLQREYPYRVNVFRWCFAGGCFLIALEEISWGQRIFGFATPSFLDNLQHETNLHNFATNPTENLYYVGSFIYLVIVPVAFSAFRRSENPLTFLSPGIAACAAALPLASLNHDMWDVVPQQAVFFLALAIAIRAFWFNMHHSSTLAFLWGVLAITLAGSQAAMLFTGHTQPRSWDSTEYKELFIAIGLMLAGLSLRGRATSE